MTGVVRLSAGATFAVYLIAFVVFVVAVLYAVTQRAVVFACISAGLALFAFVLWWNALAQT